MAQAPALPAGFELPLEARLPRIGAVDAVALEERAASLAKRSIKRESKVWALLLAIRTTDLTTLEEQTRPERRRRSPRRRTGRIRRIRPCLHAPPFASIRTSFPRCGSGLREPR